MKGASINVIKKTGKTPRGDAPKTSSKSIKGANTVESYHGLKVKGC